MKKVLSVLSLAAILATITPSVMANPHGGPGGDMGRPQGGGGRMEAPREGDYHHGHGGPPPSYHRHNGGAIAIGLGARHRYWGYPYYYYPRLGCCYDDCYPPYYGGYGHYSNPNWGVGLYFGF